MASSSITSCEKWACINGSDDEFEGIDHQVSGSNGTHAFLMSLMEELQDNVEEGDEERLNSVIQSLEAEINMTRSTDHADEDSSCMESSSDHQSVSEDGTDQSCSLGLSLDGQDFTVSFDDLDLINGWDLHMEEVPCSSSGQELNWYMHTSTTGGGDINNHYYDNNGTYYYHEVSLAEEVGDNSLCLNQTMYDSLMYD